jgi:hypothetical protein
MRRKHGNVKTVFFLLILVCGMVSCPAISAREDLIRVGHIVINEILYNLPEGRNLEEWVELYNNSDTSVNLRGWTLDDRDTHRFEFRDDLLIDPGHYVVFATNAEHLSLMADHSQYRVVAYQTARGRPLNLQIWNNDGDEILLKDQHGQIVDYVAFGNPAAPGRDPDPDSADWRGNIPTPPPGYALALFPNGYDMNSSANWAFCPPDDITPGTPNR